MRNASMRPFDCLAGCSAGWISDRLVGWFEWLLGGFLQTRNRVVVKIVKCREHHHAGARSLNGSIKVMPFFIHLCHEIC